MCYMCIYSLSYKIFNIFWSFEPDNITNLTRRELHLEARLEQQLTLNGFIVNAYEDLIKVGLDRLNSTDTVKTEYWDSCSAFRLVRTYYACAPG